MPADLPPAVLLALGLSACGVPERLGAAEARMLERRSTPDAGDTGSGHDDTGASDSAETGLGACLTTLGPCLCGCETGTAPLSAAIGLGVMAMVGLRRRTPASSRAEALDHLEQVLPDDVLRALRSR